MRGAKTGNRNRPLPLPSISSIQRISVGEIWGARVHATAQHELIHVLEGRAEIRLKNQSFTVSAEDTLIIKHGTPHRDIAATRTVYRVLYVFFEWPGYEPLLSGVDARALLQAAAGAKAHLHLMINELETAYAAEDAGAETRAQLLLLEILLAVMRYAAPQGRIASNPRQALTHQRRRRLAEDAKAYLQRHLSEQIALDRLAEILDVSPFHLCRSFAQQFGVSMIEMLTLMRVERAAELLLDPAVAVKEVTAQVGYSDANYFAKVFRRVRGISPTQHQLQHASGRQHSPQRKNK